MKPKLLSTLASAVLAAMATGAAQAQISDGVIKIGVMNDASGLYADITGQGSVIAARMAVEDFGAAAKGLKVEIVSADHQNKPDVGSTIARTWYDQDKVDVIADVPTSSVGLAVNQITQGKGQGVPRLRPGHLRPDRQGLLARTRCTGPTTPGCWPTAPARRWSRPAATAGSS